MDHWYTEYEIGSLGNVQGLFSGFRSTLGRIGRDLRLLGNNLSLVSLVFHSVRKVFGAISLPSSSIYLPLHLYEGLRQSIPTAFQGLRSQPISPAYLTPLESREAGIHEQENSTNHLKNEFGLFAPFMGFLIGCGTSEWG